jgi:hypothetical protein
MSFDVENFRVKSASYGTQPPAVCLPTKPFRINPDPQEGRITDVLLSCIEGKWYLVDPDVQRVLFDAGYSAFKANLYEGVRANGQRFVMPITYNVDGECWMNSAIAMMKTARQYWVTREADSANQRHLFSVDSTRRPEPTWSGDFLGLIEEAFGDRVITQGHPLLRSKPMPASLEEIEEFA